MELGKYTMEDYEAMSKDELIMAIIEERMEKAFEDYKPRYDEMKEKYLIAKKATAKLLAENEELKRDYAELYEYCVESNRKLQALLNCFNPKPYYADEKWWFKGSSFIYQNGNMEEN